MAGNAQAFLQISDYTLSGIDNTNRKIIVEGPVLFAIAPGSLATLAIAVGGTGWAANDEFTIPSIPGAIGKVLTVSTGVAATVSIIAPGSLGVAGTAVATAAISPSTGTGLTVTTTVNNGDLVQLLSWSITSNVLTFTTNQNTLTTGGGQTLVVQNFPPSVAFLNGSYTTSSATSTTVVVPLTHANGSGVQQGMGSIQGTYTTGGVALSWFLDLLGNARPVAGIGPLAQPTWLDVESVAGSALNYKVNLTTTPPTLLVFNGVTQLADQAAITADTVKARSEWVRGGF